MLLFFSGVEIPCWCWFGPCTVACNRNCQITPQPGAMAAPPLLTANLGLGKKKLYATKRNFKISNLIVFYLFFSLFNLSLPLRLVEFESSMVDENALLICIQMRPRECAVVSVVPKSLWALSYFGTWSFWDLVILSIGHFWTWSFGAGSFGTWLLGHLVS